MPRRLLIVVTAEVTDGALRDLVRSRGGADAEMLVVAPASAISRLDWLTNAEDDARDEAASVAETTAEATPTKNGSGGKAKTAKKAADRKGGRNPFTFVWNYLKQVVAELRKVIWPNRKQMINYTAVVLVFLAFMVALIGLVDFGLLKLVTLVFG